MSKFRMPHINQLAVSGLIDGAPCQREGFVEVRIACQKSHRNAHRRMGQGSKLHHRAGPRQGGPVHRRHGRRDLSRDR